MSVVALCGEGRFGRPTLIDASVIVAFGHRNNLSELIKETHRDLEDKPKLSQYTDCVVSAYESEEP